MSSDVPRRAVPPAAPLSAASIPPAPPLPPQRTPQPNQPTTARSAFARFVTQPFTAYGSRPATAHTNRADAGRSPALFTPKLLGPLQSQNTSLKTRGGAEITAIDISRDRTHAIVAGRDVLQTIRVDGTSCTEETNIRAAIIDHDRHNATRHRDTLDIHDVKWSHGDYGSYIATAATNGKVVIYDLGRPGIELARLHEHSRQVHRVAFNPFLGHLLLSGSQDGTVRLWDLRDIRTEVMTCRSRTRFMGQSDGVRDLKWSPKDAVEFAIGTDSGVVQKWDYRFNKGAKFRINAHDKYCTSVDWHPDGRHIMSAGQDKTVKIWDFQSEVKRQKPQWVIRTPYPVFNARWRPPCWSDDGGTWQCTQIATSYERQFATVHLWDFRRPYMPFRELCNWSSGPTDMIWHSPRLLWSVNRDGQFFQTDMDFAPKVIDRRPMQTFAISPTGEICVFSQKISRRRPSDLEYSQRTYDAEGSTPEVLPDRLERSRSTIAVDDSLDDSFLSSSYKRHHDRTTSNRSSKSAASTPPSFPDSEMHNVAKLNDTLTKQDHSISPGQIAYRGFLDGTLNALTFSYLAQKYKTSAIPDSPTVGSFLNIRKVFDQNALYAQKTGAYRMAQTWRVFGSVIAQELVQRANENRKRRLLPSHVKVKAEASPKSGKGPEPSPAILNPAIRAVYASNIASPLGIESSSNVPTPLARPHDGSIVENKNGGLGLPNPDQGEHLQLPPSIISQESISSPGSDWSSDPKPSPTPSAAPPPVPVPVIESSQWFPTPNEINERKAQMTNWRAQPKVPLDIGIATNNGLGAINIPPPLGRHNSDDSFAMLSNSSESQRGAYSRAQSFSSVRSHRPNMSQILETDHLGAEDYIPDLLAPQRTDTQKSTSTQSTSSRGGMSWLGTSSSMEFSVANLKGELTHLDASGTIVPDETSKTKQNGTGLSIAAIRELEKQPFARSDFTTIIEQLDLNPVTARELLEEVLRYYTDNMPNAQAVYHIASLLKPLLDPSLSESRPSDLYFSTSTLHAESALSTYQHQLESLQIYNPLVTVSRTAFQNNFFDATLTPNVQIGFICLGCSKPINNPSTKMRCENCGKAQAPCPICWQKYPPVYESIGSRSSIKARKPGRKSSVLKKEWSWDQPSSPPVVPIINAPSTPDPNSTTTALSSASDPSIDPSADPPPALQTAYPTLWQSCLICGHAAHASCLAHLRADPAISGKCTTEGCICDCVAGTYRAQLDAEAAIERASREAGSVRSDGRRVGESRAVKGARGLLEVAEEKGATGAAVKGEGRRVRLVEPVRVVMGN